MQLFHQPVTAIGIAAALGQADQPVFERFVLAQGEEFPGQAARQCVADDEQEGRRHRPATERLRPGPAPPPQRVARGHRPEDEQREAGDVQRTMQRYARADGRGRRAAQRMERLAHGGLLTERQEAGP